MFRDPGTAQTPALAPARNRMMHRRQMPMIYIHKSILAAEIRMMKQVMMIHSKSHLQKIQTVVHTVLHLPKIQATVLDMVHRREIQAAVRPARLLQQIQRAVFRHPAGGIIRKLLPVTMKYHQKLHRMKVTATAMAAVGMMQKIRKKQCKKKLR